jgi:hypothetical protein
LDEGVGEHERLEGLGESLGSPLGLGLVTLKALMGFSAVLGSFGLALLRGCGPGHGEFLLMRWENEMVERTMTYNV